MLSHAFLVCIVCKNTLPCGGNKEYLSTYIRIGPVRPFVSPSSVNANSSFIYFSEDFHILHDDCLRYVEPE